MLSLNWWQVVIALLSIYWPLTVLSAAAIVATGFLGTERTAWRIVWIIVALLLSSPVWWFFLFV
ncbi:hypothetical protein F9K88_12085 [Brucella intermedia]|uniref:hypothetical protein n=1 Tax=Brucella TaxID=234 RepID=UPI00046897E7|nr:MULTISPECIES: hypothetical protein [Brucella/Ochrobactrum group]MBM7329123.1 hypothetical protein [Agrobacterium sp. S2]PJT21317.1 hypothetical protein CN884_15585 [Ochrobactrum sp. 30A/1000/2015]PJT37273.1 hypothetical protein CN883_19155 [Ochrobactrum sp. 27A/999/2015]PJT42281.1 hypothetical protein CN882_16580 [Ochrobactrum sp. 23A/997/2015]KAB2710730.1 hypothetical protein F9K88_12085 [Brucella intermedia]